MEGAKYAIKAPTGAPPPGVPPKQKKKKKKKKSKKKKTEGEGSAPPPSLHESKKTETSDHMPHIAEMGGEDGIVAKGIAASVEPSATKSKTTVETSETSAAPQSPFANMTLLVPDAKRESRAQLAPRAAMVLPTKGVDAANVSALGGKVLFADSEATLTLKKTPLARPHSMFVKDVAHLNEPLKPHLPVSTGRTHESAHAAQAARESGAPRDGGGNTPPFAEARGQLNRVPKSRPSMFPAREATAAARAAVEHDNEAAAALERATKLQSELDSKMPLGAPPQGAPPQSTSPEAVAAQLQSELDSKMPLGAPPPGAPPQSPSPEAVAAQLQSELDSKMPLGAPPPGAPPQSASAARAERDDATSLRVDSTDAMCDVALPDPVRRRLENRYVRDSQEQEQRSRNVDAASDRSSTLVWTPMLDFGIGTRGDRDRNAVAASDRKSANDLPLRPRPRAEGAPMPSSRCVRNGLDRQVGPGSGRKTAVECDSIAAAFVMLPEAKSAPGLLYSAALSHAPGPRAPNSSHWRDAGLGAPSSLGGALTTASNSNLSLKGARTPPGLNQRVRSALARNVVNAPLATDPRRTQASSHGSQVRYVITRPITRHCDGAHLISVLWLFHVVLSFSFETSIVCVFLSLQLVGDNVSGCNVLACVLLLTLSSVSPFLCVLHFFLLPLMYSSSREPCADPPTGRRPARRQARRIR